MAGKKDWTLGLIDSAWFGSEHEGQAGREHAKRIGFETMDLFIAFDPGAMTSNDREAYVKGARSVDLPIISLVCAAFGLNDFNPSIRDYHIQRANNIVDLAKSFLTVRNICFVPGEYMFQKKLLPPQMEWDRVIDATQQVGRYAAERGIELAIELMPFEFAFVKTIDTMERFLDDVGLDNVKATIDISHMWLMRVAPDAIRKQLKGRVAHVHISDCDGVNHGDLPPGRGNTPFADYLAAIRDTGFSGTASLELEFSADPGNALPWVQEAYGTTRKLLADAGVHGRG